MTGVTVLAQSQLAAGISDRRREMGARSPRRFAEVYLDNHMTLEASRMHKRLFKSVRLMTANRGERIAIAAPRGHAKSTVVSLAHVPWTILYKHEPFVLQVSATQEQAVQLLRNIKHETQQNPRLLADFPDTCRSPGSRQPKPWRDNQRHLWNGTLIRAVGANQAIRGLKHKQHRPTLIIADDLEDRTNTESEDQRAKLRDWFDRTLLKLGDQTTNVIVVGTTVHHDAHFFRLTSKSLGYNGWQSEVYRAMESPGTNADLWQRWENIYTGELEHDDETGVDAAVSDFEDHQEKMLEGTKVLWPQRESYLDLMKMRLNEGDRSFQAEKQNQPTDPTQCLFNSDDFCYWDDPKDPEFRGVTELLNAHGRSFRVFAACDPSMGQRRDRGDFSAIVVLAKDEDKDLYYIIEADLKQRTPSETNDRILELAGLFSIRNIGVESNQFQSLMVDDLEKRARYLPHSVGIERLTSTRSKRERVEGLEPRIRMKLLRFNRAHTALLDQMRYFPLGAHND